MQQIMPVDTVNHQFNQAHQQPYFQSLVLPNHAFVKSFFTPKTGAPPIDLAGAVGRLADGSRYTNKRGATSFDTYAATLAANPQQPIILNCLGAATLLVSYLRKCGWSSEDVFVVLAGEKSKTEYHAWALVRAGAGFFYWINPRAPRPARWYGRDLIARFSIHAAFNDQKLCFTSDEKQGLLAPKPQTGPRFILFGKTQPGLQSALHKVIQQPAFFETKAVDQALLSEAETQLLNRHEMLCHENDQLVPGPRLTVISASQERRFHQLTDPFMETYSQLVAESKPNLRACFEDGLACGKQFRWEAVCHAVMAGMLVDLGVANHLTQRGYLAANMESTEVWAFALNLADQAFGVQSVNHKQRRLAQLWHQNVPRSLRVTAQQVDQLTALAADKSAALTPKDRLYLSHLGLVARDHGILHTTVPFFSAADMSKLLPQLTAVAEALVTRALLPALNSAGKDPDWCALPHNPSLRHAGIRLLLEQGMARLIEQAVLPPFPATDQVAPTWGRWLWEEPLTTAGLIDAMASPQPLKTEVVP